MLRRCTSLSSNQNQIYKAGISGGIASVFARYKSRPVTLSKDSGFLASTQVIPKSISSSLLTERDILIFSSLNSLSSMICRALNGPAMFYGQLLTSGDFKRSNRIVRNEHRLIRNRFLIFGGNPAMPIMGITADSSSSRLLAYFNHSIHERYFFCCE